MYVTDETGEVLGAAQWNVYEENPYAKEVAMLTPYWQPEGTSNFLLAVTALRS
jgi:hypothetical protein